MDRIAKAPEKVRKDLFTTTSDKAHIQPAHVEKDFWVCYILDYLFSKSPWKDVIAFKGGTSLSKGYNLIERFSEDIDLMLDWRVLGYGLKEPWEVRSNTKQLLFNEEANNRTDLFCRNEMVPGILADLRDKGGVDINCFVDDNNPQTVKIIYPNCFKDASILKEIRLEVGILGAWTPVERRPITSYCAEQFPQTFERPSADVLTVLPQRTFWEKVTILHREAYRPETSKMPTRYSRHYYDLCKMAKTPVKDLALNDEKLLEKVVAFKDKFYRSPWARYDLAKRGTMRLVPPEHAIEPLRKDYEKMSNMIFGEKPTFEEVMDGIAQLEAEINAK